MEVSEEAVRYAVCTWKLMPQMVINATWPEKLAAERRGVLDELTAAGLLTREDDPRGPMQWKPTKAMHGFTSDRPIPADLL